jgi:hypothetical protein
MYLKKMKQMMSNDTEYNINMQKESVHRIYKSKEGAQPVKKGLPTEVNKRHEKSQDGIVYERSVSETENEKQ